MSGAVGGAVHSIILRDAWGKQVHKAGTPTTAYLYTGQRWDELLGLYDYNARWYDPGTGRFVSADTVVPDEGDPQAYSRYTYVLNRPLQLVDPSGHTPEEQDDSELADYVAASHSSPSSGAEENNEQNSSITAQASGSPQNRQPAPKSFTNGNGEQLDVPDVTDLPSPNDPNLDSEMAKRGWTRTGPNGAFTDGKGNYLYPDASAGHQPHWDWTYNDKSSRSTRVVRDEGLRLYPDGTYEPKPNTPPQPTSRSSTAASSNKSTTGTTATVVTAVAVGLAIHALMRGGGGVGVPAHQY